MYNYIPERDDYLNWKDDWNKIPQWLDGTYTLSDTKYGEYRWNKDGFTHREDDKPAIIFIGNKIEWKQNGKDYRENDKPTIIYDDGKRYWGKRLGIYYIDFMIDQQLFHLKDIKNGGKTINNIIQFKVFKNPFCLILKKN